MQIKKGLIIVLGAGLILAISCKKKGCTDKNATNYGEKAKEDDGSCIFATPMEEFITPTTYVFKDANGNSTVAFNGQQQRLDMLNELVSYMKKANISGVPVSAQTLKKMYANNGYTWIDASTLGMTGSSKQLKNKTAGGDVGIQAIIENYMDAIDTLSSSTTIGQENGANGTGGVWPNDGEKGPYLMSGEGQEYSQLIEKGLMASVFVNQMTMNYLANISSDDNAVKVDIDNGKYYTRMEHSWDEAYGYFSSEVDFPTNGIDRFWGKYAYDREGILGSATKISKAFRKGRAAISYKDYTTRDSQILIINLEMEKVATASAIHYLKLAKINIANSTARNHYLSEAIAFIEGLKYGYRASNGGMSSTEINSVLAIIGTNFNIVTSSSIQVAIDNLASKTELTAYVNSL